MRTQPASGPARPRGFRSLPLWVQYAITFGIAAVVVVAVVLFVHHVGNSTNQEAPVTSAKAVQEENREANILVRQDQRPRVAKLAANVSPAVGIRTAVVKYMQHQIKIGVIAGPLSKASCKSRAGGSSTRQALLCNVTAAQVTYPFYGVVEPAKRQITYCKKDAPPIPSMNIPVSAKCL
jgi:hypothetical protein